MGAQQDLEKQMEDMLVKKAPFQIPENGKKAIVQYLPIISLVFGIISLLAALGLWNATRRVNDLYYNLNNLGISTGLHHYNFLYYTALVALVVQAIIMLVAYKPLKDKLKKGWDLLLLGVVLSLVFGILYLSTDTGGIGDFIGTIIGTIVGLYILAQIRSHYKIAGASKKSSK